MYQSRSIGRIYFKFRCHLSFFVSLTILTTPFCTLKPNWYLTSGRLMRTSTTGGHDTTFSFTTVWFLAACKSDRAMIYMTLRSGRRSRHIQHTETFTLSDGRCCYSPVPAPLTAHHAVRTVISQRARRKLCDRRAENAFYALRGVQGYLITLIFSYI